jgi:aspartyl-tRNA(Asn)/glutamyl-tRNA(Gln) amidotransferase subunit C
MAIDLETVKKVARLARLDEPEDRLNALVGELGGIMGWIEQLKEVDVDGVEPMATAIDMATPLRDDKVNDGNQVDAVLKNAPRALDGFFVVPKVVE